MKNQIINKGDQDFFKPQKRPLPFWVEAIGGAIVVFFAFYGFWKMFTAN